MSETTKTKTATLTAADYSERFETLKRQAEQQVAQYPQYRGHFDGYVLVVVNRNVRTKLGHAFRRGEVAIGRIEWRDAALVAAGLPDRSWVVWSQSNGCDTGLRGDDDVTAIAVQA